MQMMPYSFPALRLCVHEHVTMRFAHTGEYYGLAGQTLAGLASAGGAVLVYTGLALAWRRFVAWLRRRARTPVVTTEVA